MKNRWYTISVCVLVVSCCWGCTNIPLTHYYTFRPDIELAEKPVSSTYPYVLTIEPFETDFPYQEHKIVFRRSPYEVNFYEYHKWLQPLEKLVAEQVFKLASATQMFRHVHNQAFGTYANYIIHGNINMFDFWYSPTGSFVRIQIEYQLIAAKEDQIIWMQMMDTTREVEMLDITESITSSHIVEIVKVFEAALHDNIIQALTLMDGVLSQQVR
jgi:ABC-type uncharacterized transport system auxiliary subunit